MVFNQISYQQDPVPKQSELILADSKRKLPNLTSLKSLGFFGESLVLFVDRNTEDINANTNGHNEPELKTVLSLRPPIAVLLLLIAALGIIVTSLAVRILRMHNKQRVTSYERFSQWLLVGLVTIAILSISAFGIYALFFMRH